MGKNKRAVMKSWQMISAKHTDGSKAKIFNFGTLLSGTLYVWENEVIFHFWPLVANPILNESNKSEYNNTQLSGIWTLNIIGCLNVWLGHHFHLSLSKYDKSCHCGTSDQPLAVGRDRFVLYTSVRQEHSGTEQLSLVKKNICNYQCSFSGQIMHHAFYFPNNLN